MKKVKTIFAVNAPHLYANKEFKSWKDIADDNRLEIETKCDIDEILDRIHNHLGILESSFLSRKYAYVEMNELEDAQLETIVVFSEEDTITYTTLKDGITYRKHNYENAQDLSTVNLNSFPLVFKSNFSIVEKTFEEAFKISILNAVKRIDSDSVDRLSKFTYSKLSVSINDNEFYVEFCGTIVFSSEDERYGCGSHIECFDDFDDEESIRNMSIKDYLLKEIEEFKSSL